MLSTLSSGLAVVCLLFWFIEILHKKGGKLYLLILNRRYQTSWWYKQKKQCVPHFLCVASPREKKKKRNINNNLTILPSYDKLPCYCYQITNILKTAMTDASVLGSAEAFFIMLRMSLEQSQGN